MPLVRGSLLAIAVMAVVAACSAAAPTASSGSQAGVNGGGASPTIAFATPGDGAKVTIPFEVDLDSSVPLGTPESGDHHAHLYFDSGTDAADYDIVYGTSFQVTRPLAPGQHTITVALANPDHSLAGPTQTITVTVGDGAVGAGGAGSSGGAASPAATPAGKIPGY